ncbi:hypothetical protein H8356DRAFT_923548 [Neocallimastix lanati (nom. inval.)]|jgi:hypothetical protein|uniref:CBM21 domain-containing protein n=1 Tax=Neocallimastix californiae TaxID=1754190 RepID=A0A1Y2ET52_9FUNG|nr:hypothetical protein H8356DRAFT_923548 [Neocallimastix sp. JGI-2020a]ORY74474.1 hypothetical protein LY90DRAFT_502624 [Neocallimastix californiae]|eukprot:ORY74474.1 hypothetical protein LY90DRAFT_502624 [Neocallimastix californiae]
MSRSISCYDSSLPAIELDIAQAKANNFNEPGKETATYIEGTLLVRSDAGMNKSVYVRLCDPKKHWINIGASYLRTIDDRTELWYFKTPSYGYDPGAEYVSFQFALCLVVPGRPDVWDNNYGNNYEVGKGTKCPTPLIAFGSRKLIPNLESIMIYDGWKGSIYVSPAIGKPKDVSIIWSLDKWKSENILSLQYVYQTNQVDIYRWNIELNVPQHTEINYYFKAITENGEIYVDTNNNKNYDLINI